MNPNAILIGLAGGVAAALLFAAVIGGGALGLPLFALAPLPLAIAALGWGTAAGAAGAIVGTLAIGAMSTPSLGLLFALLAAPTAWYAHLAGLARPADDRNPAAGLEWYPLDRVFLALVVGTIVSLILAGALVGVSVDTVAEAMADAILKMAADAGDTDLPARADLVAASRFYVRLMPATVTMLWLSVVLFDLWLGARVVRLSSRLRRPWTPLYDSGRLPRWTLAAFVAAAGVAAVDGAPGLIAGAVAGGFGMAFALAGFAVIHRRLRNHPARSIILALLYGATFVFSLPLIPVALVGMANAAFGTRAPPGPPPAA